MYHADTSRSDTPTYVGAALGATSTSVTLGASSAALGAPPSGGPSTSATFGSPPAVKAVVIPHLLCNLATASVTLVKAPPLLFTNNDAGRGTGFTESSTCCLIMIYLHSS
jgi:hypothetical protein